MPGEAEGIVIRAVLSGAVELVDFDVALANKVVVADHGACNGGKEDRVRREVSGEAV